MIRPLALVLALVGLLALPAQAQRNAAAQDADLTPRRNAFTLGAHLHTHGIGVDFQYRYLYRPKWEMIFNTGIASLKDRVEARTQSALSDGQFIYDKVNYVYTVPVTFGMQRVLVERGQFSKIRFKAGLQTGPVITLLKPYSIEVLSIRRLGPRTEYIISDEAYDPANPLHIPNNVFGESDFFTNFSVSARLGWRVRAAFSLDLADSSWLVKSLEFGLQGDFFGSTLPIMGPSVQNRSAYYGGYLGLLLGNAW